MTNSASQTNQQLLQALTSLKDLRGRLEAVEAAKREPIAIIGMGCRFPGANGPAAYWDLLRDGIDAITETPATRWDTTTLYDAEPESSGKVAIKTGGFLEDIDQFDAAFFGISPREAAQMDPQQRLLLEVAWEALEDGGQAIDELGGSKTGVFIGVHSHSSDYYLMQAADLRDIDLYSGTGTSHSVISGRLSYLLDLRGPSLAIDTACSSSLVAVHLAVQSLRNGECSLALAGGVNTIIDPTFTVVASRMRIMSESGRCRPFDAAADGFVRSEGCGVVVLKRLSDAIAAGDRVLALIHGSAVNQDGRSNGLTAPNSLSQQAVILEALDNAGVKPHQIGLIEAHGTGTTLGDPIEIESLREVFGSAATPELDEDSRGTCVLGAAKANIGHTEGAAGVASLIKTVLSLRAAQIPPLVHFEQLNPHLSLAGTPFVIPTTTQPWPANSQPRYAGISSFGWSGTNAHVIVGEAPAVSFDDANDRDGSPVLLPISARSTGALHDLAGAYRALLLEPASPPLGDICVTAALRRSHHHHRLAVAGRSRQDLVEHLDAFLAGNESRGLALGNADGRQRDMLVFVFPGQGSQWPGMARRLLRDEPVFRAAINKCEQAMRAYVDWSLLEELSSDAPAVDIERIDVIQPVLFAIQVALAAMWRSRGVVPDAVVGHSMGEVAAAHVAGILSLDDAARIICRRSQLLRRISGQGGMAVVDQSIDEARTTIRGYEDRLAIAVSNSAKSTVLSGDTNALDEILARLTEQDIFCRRVKVDVASHSPQVDVLREDLLDALRGLQPRTATIPFFSTVTVRFEDGPALDGSYWARNLRQPVLFGDSVGHLIESGHRRFVELSPHPVLLSSLRETLDESGKPGVAIASLQRDSDEPVAMYSALAALYADGYSVDWADVQQSAGRVSSGRPPVDLPRYAWQHERHWLEARSDKGGQPEHHDRVDPLLGWTVPVAGPQQLEVWQNSLSRADQPALYDYRIANVPNLPASATLEIFGAAARSTGHVSIADVSFERPLYLDDEEPTSIQVVVEPNWDTALATIYRGDSGEWTRHVTATLTAASTDIPPPLDRAALAASRAGAHAVTTGNELYERLQASGVTFGPALRTIERLWWGDGELSADLVGSTSDGAIQPLLDACLQVAACAGLAPGLAYSLTPISAQDVLIRGEASKRMTCVAKFRPGTSDGTTLVDAFVYDADGIAIGAVEGLLLRRLDVAAARTDDMFFRLEWQRAEATLVPSRLRSGVVIVADTIEAASWGEALQTELVAASRGAQATKVIVTTAEHLATRLADLAGDSVDVVFLASEDGGSEAVIKDSCVSLLRVVRALERAGRRASLHVVTRGAQAVRDGEQPVLTQAPLWGFGRTIAEELPELWGGLIDLKAQVTPEAAANALAHELTQEGATSDTQVAWRGDQRFVLRLVRHEALAKASLQLRADATYVITGGFGTLGSDIARWMVAQGARRLVLLGRTQLPTRSEWTSLPADTTLGQRVALVRELEASGAAVHVASLDVGDEASLRQYFEQFAAEGWPAVRGVIHAAADLESQLMVDIDPAELWSHMQAKVVGGATLADIFPELDLFVMFSSIAAVMPQAGQAAYSAANAFLDALAQQRSISGQRRLSVNWGAWLGVGGVMRSEQWQRRIDQMQTAGLGSFQIQQGLEALGRLINDSIPQAVFIPIDLAPFDETTCPALLRDLFADWNSRRTDGVEGDAATSTTSLVQELNATEPDKRQVLMEASVRAVVGRVLKLPETRIEPTQTLGALGLDSLMAIELRNHLGTALGMKLSATLAWNFPTVRDLASYLLGRLYEESTESPAAVLHNGAERGERSESLDSIVAAIDDLSDDDVMQALMGKSKP